MAYFFSEKMTYCEALVPSQIAWDVFNELGQQSCIALQSSSINYENAFIKSFRRCDQTLAKITMIRSILVQYKPFVDFTLKQVSDQKAIWQQFKNKIENSKMEGYLYINQIQDEIIHAHTYLYNQLHELESLTKKVTELIMEMGLLVTLAKDDNFKALYGGDRPKNDFAGEIYDKSNMFQTKCICISRKDLMILKRGLFRITRSNSWVYEIEINLDELNHYFNISKHRTLTQNIMKTKVALLIVYQKGERNILQSKIQKFLGCFDAHILAAEISNIRQQLPIMQRKISQIESMQELTLEGMKKYVDKLCEVHEGSSASWLCYMEIYTKKQREIYRALSTTRLSKNLVRFNLFIPLKNLPLNIQPKANLPPLILNIVETNKMMPSKFDTNQMLMVPQEIVNTYGVPSYEQINPAPFYIITFGFFIGVMFGDVGHMLLAIPLLLHFKANIWFWTVVLFMGYCGLIYNEFFGLNIGLFSSCYNIIDEDTQTVYIEDDCVYPFGIDSIWKTATNEMQFTNSLKMKAAVIIGVVHMMFGLFLRLFNNIKQKKILDIITLTIPQIIFMTCTFVYMDYLIIYKWSSQYDNSTTAPSIISTMISVFVNMASENAKDLLFWPGQRSTEKIIVIIAFSCIPVMLFAKTAVIYCRRRSTNTSHIQLQELAQEHQNQEIELQQIESDKISDENMKTKSYNHSSFKISESSKQHEEPLQEVAVHQFIETIEFVLGTVSNTASYLRLWALSLAHAQLSTVIFQLTVLKQLQGGYSKLFGLFLIFPFYLTTTFGVLICMDSLQCFLHSLRLHWVQFQNKFYEGKGYLFQPFSFQKMK